MRKASDAPSAEPERHAISFSRRSTRLDITRGTAMTMATANDSNGAAATTNDSNSAAAATAAHATNTIAATTTFKPKVGAPCVSAATTAMAEEPVAGKGRKWDKTNVPAGKRIISLEGLQVLYACTYADARICTSRAFYV